MARDLSIGKSNLAIIDARRLDFLLVGEFRFSTTRMRGVQHNYRPNGILRLLTILSGYRNAVLAMNQNLWDE
jgi:hypothetical protein